MLPTLLYIKKEDNNIAIRKILVSVCYPYYKDPRPSVSMTIYLVFGSWGFYIN